MGKTLKEIEKSFENGRATGFIMNYAKCQADCLTEEAPILGVIPFQEISHNQWSKWKRLAEIAGNGCLSIGTVNQLRKVDLSILSGEVEVPEDTANMFGGREKYFARKMPKVLRRSGMAAEQHIIYNNFHAWALDNNNAVNAGASSGGTYSILAVHFSEGETCGLYNSECFKQGGIVDIQPNSGGNLYKAPIGAYAGVLVYGLRIKAYLGMQIGDPHSVGALVNVSAGHLPTQTMIDDLLASARATTNGKTYLFMHERVHNMLCKSMGKYDVEHQLTYWNGVKIVTSYNFLDGTENVVEL